MKSGEGIMDDSRENNPKGMTRREALKISGAMGGLVIGGVLLGPGMAKAQTSDDCGCPPGPTCYWKSPSKAQQYSYFETLPLFRPYDFHGNKTTTIAPLGHDEMRISFMGSCIPPVRRAQQMMSVFVEVGWDDKKQMPLDNFVFDCGSGVCANYGAMNVGFGRMDKVFIAHLHGDHMSDLTHIYAFGPSADRKSPLYVFGPDRSGYAWTDPNGKTWPKYKDGTADYCLGLRQACRWHTESFSFQTTSYPGYPTAKEIKAKWGLPCTPAPVVDTDADGNTLSDPYNDAYAIIPIELNWKKVGGVAYCNKKTGARITHFPVIHTRRGSIGYKLEWWPKPSHTGDRSKPHLSMIYTSDTKPEYNCVSQASNGGKGVDVLIHEMVVPAQVWAMKNEYSDTLPSPTAPSVQVLETVQNSSHSPQGAFGYLLSQTAPRPRLTVATHFPVADDTVACAIKSVQEHFPTHFVRQGNNTPKKDVRITWSFDLMVITASKNKIVEHRAEVSDFGFSPWENYPVPTDDMNPPKYWKRGTTAGQKVSDPYAQIDTTTQIPSCGCGTDPCTCNYRDDGY
jgi:ribonuclease Z